MEEKGNCDSPDLWGQIKSIKDQFPRQYKHLSTGTPSQISSNQERKEIESTPAFGNRNYYSKSGVLGSRANASNITSASSHSVTGVENTNTNSPATKAERTRKSHKNMEASPSTIAAPQNSSKFKSRRPSYPPDIPLRDGFPSNNMEFRGRSNSSNQHSQPKKQKFVAQRVPCAPSPPINEPSDIPQSKLNREAGINNTSPMAPEGVAFFEHKQAFPPKVSESDDSDENLLRHLRRPTTTNTMSQPSHGRRQQRSPQNVEQVAGLKSSHNRHLSTVTHNSRQEPGSVPKDLATTTKPHPKKEVPAKSRKEDRKGSPLTQEELDWLKRMQGEIVVQAHLNRLNELQTASPEALVKCRDGPGTDRNSSAYKEISKFRTVGEGEIPGPKESAGSLHTILTEGIESPTKDTLRKQLDLGRDLYTQNPATYPILADGKISLSTQPTEEHERVLAKLRKPPREGGSKTPKQHNISSQIPENSWTDGFIADWEYHSRKCPDYEMYRGWFQAWLQETTEIPHRVDIYHHSFFDGTAHADGIKSMFILEMGNYETHLDLNDEETWLHWYENAEGYCHNICLHSQKAEDDKRNRRKIERQIYMEAMQSSPLQSPISPKASIYLRPVDIKDIPELQDIYNWYARNSTRSHHTEHLDLDTVRQVIEGCSNEKFPFIVAVDRGTTSAGGPEKILGYGLAMNFSGPQAAGRFIAELEVFVREGHKKQGIGRCLLDKLLEVCDPTYSPKGGYVFEASAEGRSGYYAGGRRRLARLVFTFSYVDGKELSDYKWVKEWLEKGYQFEEQGLLKGGRIKFGNLLNVCYLVRNVGFNKGNKWE